MRAQLALMCFVTLFSTAVAFSQDGAARIKMLQELVRTSQEQEIKAAETLQRAKELDADIKSQTEEWRRNDEENLYSVGDRDFVVRALGKSNSESFLKVAAAHRSKIGKELPPARKGKTWCVVSISIIGLDEDDDAEEEVTVWVCGKGRALSGAHRIWITATKERVAELLQKAIEKLVLAQQPMSTLRKP